LGRSLGTENVFKVFIDSSTVYVRFQVLKAASMKLRISWDVLQVDFQLRTWQYIPRDSELLL
jgi:hypothetical protein